MQLINSFLISLLLRLRSERGQDLLEYALLGGLVAAAIITVAGLGIMSGAISTFLARVGDCIDFDNLTTCEPF